MANICSVVVHVDCMDEKEAKVLFDNYDKKSEIQFEEDEDFAFCHDTVEIDRNDSRRVNIYGQVRWFLEEDNMVSILNLILSVVPVRKVVAFYEECGECEYGKYTYENGVLKIRYVDQGFWPEWLDEYDDDPEPYYDKLDSLLDSDETSCEEEVSI